MHLCVFFCSSKTSEINWGKLKTTERFLTAAGAVRRELRSVAHVECSCVVPSEDVQECPVGTSQGRIKTTLTEEHLKVSNSHKTRKRLSVLESRDCQISTGTLEKGPICAVAFKEIIAITALSWEKKVSRTIKNPWYDS